MNLSLANRAGAPEPLRVMHVVFSLGPGGMEHGVLKLVNGLDRSEVRSSICATAAGGALKPLVKPDVPVFELHRRPGNDPSLVWQLYQVFRRERPHIVHTHAWGTLCEGLIAARLARVPVIVHGEHGTLQLKPHQATAQRLVWQRVDRLLSVSSRLAERMSEHTGMPLNQITVIRNGVDLSRFHSIGRSDARQALGLPQDALVVGTAGRLVPVKEQATLLEALADIAHRGTPFLGLIAGEGPLRTELEGKAARLGIADRVRFLGHRPDIERVFAALDIFVLSSSSEGLSNTILEAMASGLPVVATRVGGADELVEAGITGILVPPGSPAGLAQGIARFAADQGFRQSAGIAGRRRALTQFTLERMLRDYRNLYCDLDTRIRPLSFVSPRTGT